MAQKLKNLPAMRETWVQSLGQEDLLEKGMVTHSSILVCRIPWAEEPALQTLWGHKESDTTERLTLSLFTFRLSLCLLQHRGEPTSTLQIPLALTNLADPGP